MKKLIVKIKNMDLHRRNHIVMQIGVAMFVILVIYRFVAFGVEHYKSVFNMTRDSELHGVSVSVMTAQKSDGVIYEPLFVNDNRGYVSGMRVARFKPGQKITGGGEVVSVSTSLDLDTGMHIVRTRGATNGAHTVEIRENGFYIPTDAVKNGTVFVVRDGVAHAVSIDIVRGDGEHTMITGVSDGDIIITSHIADGDLVRVIK